MIHALSVAAAFLVPAVVASSSQDAPKKLTFEQAAGRASGPSFGARAERYRWAPDGVHLTVTRDDKELWIDPETGEPVEPVQPVAAPAEGAPAEGEPAEAPPAETQPTTIFRPCVRESPRTR